MDIFKKNRRKFLKNTLVGAAGLSSLSLLSACSSFEDYLFDDRYSFKEEVMIVGGGISGLYLAYKLRNNKTEFRLFEGANSFGGRIKSFAGSDYGASLLSVNDIHARQLVKELLLPTINLNKEYFYLPEGMQSLSDVLVERIMGLLPYRNFRVRWKLVEIRKHNAGFELVFENPTGQKRFKCKKIALALPPSQWPAIAGLMGLPEMKWAADWLGTLKIENSIKIILPGSALSSLPKPLVELNYENLDIRQIIKKNKDVPTVEIDLSYPINESKSIENVYNVLKKKLQLSYPFEKLSTDQYFDWQQVKLIKGAKFVNNTPMPDSIRDNFQIVGDFAVKGRAIHTIEGALQSATRASELLL